MALRDRMSVDLAVLPLATKIDQAVQQIKRGVPTYLVIPSSGGQYTVKTFEELKGELEVAADRLGPAILNLTLADIPGLVQASQTLDVETNEGEAIRAVRRSRGRRVVVLEAGQPVGILYQAVRAGIFGGVPTQLHGPRYGLFEQPSQKGASYEPRSCPNCRSNFDFYDIQVVGGAVQYACPNCSFIFTDVSE